MKKARERRESCPSPGINRRGFLGTLGIGVISAAVTHGVEAAPIEDAPGGGALIKINLLINGRSHSLMTEPRTNLLFVLRDRLGMTGTKLGCERGECGACTVLIDNQPRYSCLTLAPEAEGHEITTIEGLMHGERLGPVQQAFLQEDAFQCGYCTPGQIVAAEGLLRKNPDPSLEEIREGMSGNLCRCGAYQHIFKAVRRASELKKRGGAA